MRQRAREAVDRAQDTRDRTAAVHRERALVEQLEATARELEGLRTAMSTRATIEQAKGVLMGLRGCGPEEAFQHLIRLSQVSQRKLHDVAALVVADVSNGHGLRNLLDAGSSAARDS